MPTGHLLQGAVLMLALSACAATPPPAAEPAAETAAASATPGPERLLRPGRVLHFRGRSTSTLSRADLAPAPQVGWVLTELRVLAREPAGRLSVEERSFLYSADGDSPGRLGDAQEQRTRRLLIDPAAGEMEVGPAVSAPTSGAGRHAGEVEISITDDGFGLNSAARDEVGLATLLLTPETFRRLAAGETVSRAFDFWLVREAPRADRLVVPRSAASAPPAGAEGRVWGRSELRPLGEERHVVDWRPAPPGTAVSPGARPPAAPDLRVELPARGVGVVVELTVERPTGEDGAFRSDIQRRDRLTWVVLDDPSAPWLLAWDGNVHWRRGEGDAAELREAYLSRSLFRVEETAGGDPGLPASP